MAFHKNLVEGSIHQLHNYEYADATARNAASGFVADDVGKVARQVDNGSFWILKSHSPVTWSPMGGGAGGGARNLLQFDASFAPTDSDSSDFEGSIGGWAVYADAAAVTPVDMTGGSPNSTLVRSTSSPLDGSASGLLTLNSGASRQGEGISKLVNVPPRDRNQTKRFQLSFSTTGVLVEDDLRLYAYAVDGNAIGPRRMFEASKILGESGTAIAYVDVPSGCTQIRVGIHVARTTTGALTLKIDDVVMTDDALPQGLAGTDWIEYPATLGASTTPPTLGTTTRNKFQWRRVGSDMEIRYDLEQTSAGTTGSGNYLIPLPTGYQIDTTKMPVPVNPAVLFDTSRAGSGISSNTRDITSNGSNLIVYPFSATALGFALQNTSFIFEPIGSANYALNNADMLYSIVARVPIVGWDANVTLSSSAKINISHLLATGTRVTGTPPTSLGEYRSYRRNAGASTYTETNAAPTPAPSVADGIKIWTAATNAAADANNQPSKYEIFVGKNKNIRVDSYQSAGRMGFIVTDVQLANSTTASGLITPYDPTTGILTVQVHSGVNHAGGVTGMAVGVDTDYGLAYIEGFFDVIVSENALSVGIETAPYAFCTSTSTAAITGTPSIVDFETKVEDTHGAVTTGASWKFTAPESRIYTISSLIYTNSGNNTINGSFVVDIWKNGSFHVTLAIDSMDTTVASSRVGDASVDLRLMKGDYIDLRVSQSTGNAFALQGSAATQRVIIVGR